MQLDLFIDAKQPETPVAKPSVSPRLSPKPIAPVEAVEVVSGSASPQDVPVTLRDVMTFYEGEGSGHPRCAQFKSALRQVAKVFDQQLEDLPADPARMRKLLQYGSPARVGIKPNTWKQMKSTALGGLRGCGVAVLASRDSTPLSPTWQVLNDALPDRSAQIGLSRFLRSLSRNGVEPPDVSRASFEQFKTEVETLSVRSNPRAALSQTAKFWNKAMACVPGWPQVLAPVPRDGRHRYSLDWSEFRPTFVAEVEAFLDAKHNPDPLEENFSKPVRPATTDGRRKSLRQFASALALSGRVQTAQITGLGVLTEIENVRAALRFFRARRPGEKFTEGELNYLHLMKTIAKHWLNDREATKELSKLIQQVRAQIGPRPGMTPKNRERLRQFVLPANVDALINLPADVLKKVGRKPKPSYRKSVDVMRGLQVGLLTFVPIRCENLTGLKLGENIIEIGQGPKRTLRVHLSSKITKTSREYEAPLPKHLHPIYDAWIEVHRPNISQAVSPYLFPNPSGALRNKAAVSTKLSRFIERETGLQVHTHLFRHIAAKLYLDHDPGGIEIVRQLLGHSSTRTTLKVYADLQTDPAFKRFEDALLGDRDRVTSAKRQNGRQPAGAYLS